MERQVIEITPVLAVKATNNEVVVEDIKTPDTQYDEEYGRCCFCHDICNLGSQCCGHCARNVWKNGVNK